MQTEDMQQQPQIESPELELERERRKRAEFEYRTEKSKREAAQKVEEIKQEKFKDELRRQLASTGLKFHIADSELRMLLEKKSGVKFNIQNDGRFNVEQNGTETTFKDAVEQFAVQHSFLLTDCNQIAHLTKPIQRLSKADFPTPELKAKVIHEKGLEFWENLPLRAVPDVPKEQLTREIYLAASAAQKIKWALTEREIALLIKYGTLNGRA